MPESSRSLEYMYNSIKNDPVYQEFLKERQSMSAPVSVTGLNESRKVQFAHETAGESGWTLFITTDEKKTAEIQSDYLTFEKNVWVYPARDLLFYTQDIHSNFIRNQRADARKHLIEDAGGVLVTTIDGLMDKIPSRKSMCRDTVELSEGMIIPIRNLSKLLAGAGYERVPEVEAMGQFAVRGGIIDIFPMSEEMPVRVEFFDDEIDTIRIFDPETRRSVERVEKASIFPSGDEGNEEVSLLDWFPESALIIADDPVRLRAKAELTEAEFREAAEKRLSAGVTADEDGETGLAADIFGASEIMDRLKNPRTVYIAALDDSLREFGAKRQFDFSTGTTGTYKDSFELLITDIRHYEKEMFRVTVMTPSRTRASRLAERLREEGIHAFCPDERSGELRPGTTEVVYGTLNKGYLCPGLRYVLLTEADMFGSARPKKAHRKGGFQGEKLSSLEELSVGDYVVHESHGIGVYKGIERIEQDEVAKDYIHIEYGDGGSLYLPATRLDLVQKYSGADGRKPKLSKLNSGEWQKTRQRVAGAVNDLAKELVELYARRSVIKGFQCGPDTVWQKEFEELFPYEETEDQLNAIEAVKRDMESERIMDRLVCGDVGYGKTEIALRAAFKAVQEGRQVVYLVPTTILCRQHYNTFKERMANFPVEVDMMCRFRTSAENKKTAERLKTGLCDIVIGTHRVLSKDVNFKNLGLLIIDEEQRFGVSHKEKIKKLKNDVDVLVLTATPIPRTLHMSLSGIRDLSILEEPPFDRVPIQTYVMEYNDELVREAVNRELSRNGQVFYVYNRVKGIEEKAAHLQHLLPGARVEYAHGQMPERQLESIMVDFVEGNIDVLLSTTIIETGLDIPNANTLIVDGAENLGLSQLYQIRGRVGRSNRTSYAFLMYRKDRILSEEAEKRLKAIREFTEFGSGIKIAMRDLEIRGAGNVLGSEQSGQMEAVGYELYVKLLKKAVRLLSGIVEEREEFVTTIDCDVDAFIPDTYIRSEYQKLDIYKRISGITNEEAYADMQDELTDRFGDIPAEVENLLRIALTKALAHRASISEITIKKDSFFMTFLPDARINVDAVPDVIAAEKGKLRLERGKNPRFIYRDLKSVHIDAGPLLLKAGEILGKIVL